MMRNLAILLVGLVVAQSAPLPCPADDSTTIGWTAQAPRPEMRPRFAHLPGGGRDSGDGYRISADKRIGLHGFWQRTLPVKGGRHYRFEAFFQASGVSNTRRSVVAVITWLDADGELLPRASDRARPEFPEEGATGPDEWTAIAQAYLVPQGATQAVVQLHLRFARNASVVWSDVSLAPVAPPSPRLVRLASAHFRPSGGSSADDNCRAYEPLIAEAARQRADLVCLGETITYVGNGLSADEAAEPIPGPSTEYFGSLARKYALDIVVGLIERDGQVLYNVAVLIGPDGEVAGKYRKVCLPREEIEKGFTPGDAYPVFDRPWGRLGMLVCWDVHFPEVARRLSNRGAEVLALPIWGGNPLLARARAVENQVHVVTSTYSSRDDWMRTGIIDPRGDWIVQAGTWGEVVVTEVDLSQPVHWDFLGNFRARIPREQPAP